ncbi:PLP-dependent aminotransferase family protein [Ottowia thiooxydans]|uniref:aminotransferase-like domain-containing protein n=1 Tax=Ottowia thiooxydans TaxID=219182 RepID=UPI00146EA074|nr:PLP-dependent aminotransferase family protein [Ottowia thiooxydans]
MSTLKLYEHLANELSKAIGDGLLPGGSALPTHREFAREQRIGLSTATRVYAELQRRGLIIGEVGRGTFVRERPIGAGALSEAVRYTTMARTAESIDAPTLRRALRSLSALPNIERLAAQVSSLGSPSIRRGLAMHLERAGLTIDPAQIATAGGGMAAMRLAALVALKRGQRVAVDEITYPGWRLVSEQLGLDVVPVPVDQHGPVPEALEQLFRRKRITALHCMPTAHLPLGWVVPAQRRRDIAALACEHEVVLLEDVTYNHLAPTAPRTFAQLAPERTGLIGSLSGVMGDGLRFGYLVAPRPLGATTEREALSWGLATPPLVAELAHLWLGEGLLASLQSAQLEHAKQLWDAISGAGLKPKSPSRAGWTLWLPLPSGGRCEEVALQLRQQGIDALSSEPFATAARKPNAIVVRMRSMTAIRLREIAPTILSVCGFSRHR